LKWFLATSYVKVFGGDSYAEITGIAAETVALGKTIDWTVFRVPVLSGEVLDENQGEVNAVHIGDSKGRDALHLERTGLARWILTELDEMKWIGRCPLLANA